MKRFSLFRILLITCSMFLLSPAVYAAPTPEADSESAAVSTQPSAAPDAPSEPEAPQPTTAPDADVQPSAEPEASAPPTTAPDMPQPSAFPAASAQPTPSSAAPAVDPRFSNAVELRVLVHQRRYILDSLLTVELYDANGSLLGTADTPISQDSKWVSLHYDVPVYELGKTFTVKLTGGVETLQYYDTVIGPGGSFPVVTALYYGEDGAPIPYNSFVFDAVPLLDKPVTLYINGSEFTPPTRARLAGDITLVPIRAVAEALGVNVYYDSSYDSIVCSVGKKTVLYNIADTYATFFGKDFYLPTAPCYYDDSVYVPLRSFADAFGASLDVVSDPESLTVSIGPSRVVNEAVSAVSSRTGYMVWVSKSEYRVRVYQGSKNNWTLVHTAPCAIGAPDTPTITGSFEYIEKTLWDYGSYYVGPVLRFYGGYALHSTLLYYGGGEYDGRVGVKISHGCIRMKAPDINWIASTIPLYTRIYITE